ncbi:PREDICTED: uncharacterized protein LOC100639991 [Amphimedon queenslandica]|uniref:Receptor protein-tyrosine kinase n=1 Tax=Amphimedon queenslandica TaxID=400682 RepID=A0A1X7URJ7_AMPQE|nr:PREDICTED: uncharacterized protein LOC100639991 [Amphimedon queenslandica]|eukprot:XP_003387055.2 PREDICTED: uncharacterized protein LOC100639991 [Amphimedon queenslandica]
MAGQAIVVFILTLLIVSVSSQIKSGYDVINPSPFNGSNETMTDPNSDCAATLITCFGNTSKLTDGYFGPMDSLNGQLGRFFAFNQNDSRLTFNPFSAVPTVVLYFFNSPADGIGLPQLEVSNAGPPVPYFFFNNDELTLTDSQLRTVTLHLNQTLPTFQIDFTFPSNSRIDWFLVSEVQLFAGTPVSAPMEDIAFKDGSISVVTLGPDNIESSISINCTILNNGSFHWNWLFNNTIPITDELFIEDATRTSILYINGLSYSNEGNYTCTANSTAGSMASKRINLLLEVSLTTPQTTVAITSGQSVTISCQMTGYLRPGPIQWKRNGVDIMSDGNNYVITTATGDPNAAIDTNGATTSGIISILNNLNGDTGTYTCEIPGTDQQQSITVSIGTGSTSTSTSSTVSSVAGTSSTATGSSLMSPTTSVLVSTILSTPSIASSMSTMVASTDTTSATISTMTTSSTSPTSTAASLPVALVGGIAGGTVLVLVLIVVIIILLACVVCKKKRSKSYEAVLKLEGHPKEQVTPVEPYYRQPKKILPYSETEFLSDDAPLPVNHGTTEYSYIDHSTAQIMSNNDANDMYQEIPEPLPPRPAPISGTKPYFMRENPQYEPAVSRSTLNKSYDNIQGSNFDIYATPNVPPPIPDYKGSLFDINLDPSHFTSQENLTRPSSVTDGGTPQRLLPFPSTYAQPLPVEKSQSSSLLEVTEDNVKIISELGVGQFGKVFLAHTVGLTLSDLNLGSGQTTISVLVAVKVLHSDADELERETFEKEVKFMSRIKHENIIQILGVCLKKNSFIMMEYMENGDLNQYLQKFEYSPDDQVEGGSFITSSSLVYIALQVAGGMRYLAGQNYVHRDLATRNCLVGQKFLVKIADFGMSRQLYDNNYYRIRGRAMLPIRWMAKECFYGRFTEKTDVWAYGVVMWEIFTLCQCQPYETLNDQEVIDNALAGPERKLLSQPVSCSNDAYDIMLRCWVDDPEARASFEELHGRLAQIHAYD